MRLLALLLAALFLAFSAPRPAPELAPEATVPVLADQAAHNVGLGDTQGRTGAPTSGEAVEGPGADIPTKTGRALGTASRVTTNGGAPLFARTGIGTAAFGGLATWYATPGFTAAAGPDLRAIRGWRGSLVKVTSRGKSVIVRLTDACWCPPRNGRPVLLDLSRLAFSRLATPSAGVIVVSVEVGGRLPKLPATDTVP